MDFQLTHQMIAQSEAPPAVPAGGGGGQAQPQGPMGGGFMIIMLVMMVLMFVLTGRSQRKKQKELDAKLDAMKTGDEVITAGGIHGRVANRNPEKGTVTVQVAEGVKIKFNRASITSVTPKGKGDDSDAEDETDSEDSDS